MITRQEIVKRAHRKKMPGINEAFCRRLEPNGRGLIPKAEIQRLGRGKGVIACYPDGTDQLVFKIGKLRRNGFSYDSQIPLALWNMEHEVDILPLFKKSLKEYRRAADLLTNMYKPDSTDQADIFQKIAEERLSNFDPSVRKMIGQIRKWVGKKYMPTTIAIICWTITGHPETTSIPDDNEYDRRAFVSPIVRTVQGIATIPSIKEFINNIRGHFDPDNLDETLHPIGDTGSQQQYLRQGYREVSNALVIVSGITGWKISFPKLPAAIQCILTLVWLSLRQEPKLLKGYQELMNTANKLSPVNILYQETPPKMTPTTLERVYGLPPDYRLGITPADETR